MSTGIQPAAARVRDRVTAEEWQTRVDLAAAYRLAALYGWDDLIFTHISARVPENAARERTSEHFLINPYCSTGSRAKRRRWPADSGPTWCGRPGSGSWTGSTQGIVIRLSPSPGVKKVNLIP